MEAASDMVYIRGFYNEEEDEDVDKCEVSSDELNNSFDSDDENEQDFMFMKDVNIAENQNHYDKDQEKSSLLDLLGNRNLNNQAYPLSEENLATQNTDACKFSGFSYNSQAPEIPQFSPLPMIPPMPPMAMMPPPVPQSIGAQFCPPPSMQNISLVQCSMSPRCESELKPELPRIEKAKKQEKVRYHRQGRKFKNEVDTNVICLKLKVLKEDAELAAGDPIFCQKCSAVFNMHSKLGNPKPQLDLEEIKEEVNEDEEEKVEIKEEDLEQDGRAWICEFCDHKNIIDVEDEEIPTKNAMNYILETGDSTLSGKKAQESAIIFCIDISGSMCVTKAVEGKFKIKGDKYDELQALMKFSDGSDQFAFNDRNVTYVSRLQCVQAAIESQLIEMKTEKSKQKVGLVSFNGDVTIIGDGSQIEQVISGDKLKNYEYLLDNGQKIAKTHLQQGIDHTEKQLNEKLYAMEETGPTALGPAVVSAIAMAGECGNGSSVVICTDGLANVGVGCLEEQKDGGKSDVEIFYQKLGEYANQKGVTVNIISIKGEECDLETLSPLYEKTGGNVDIIEPEDLMKNFANIFKKEVIATKVVTKIKLHKALEFRNEEPEDLNEDKTLLTRDVGNVTEDSEITFEYRVKNKEDLAKLEGFDINKLEIIPFQTIIYYTKLNGSQCIRTLTQIQKVTNNIDEAQQKAKIDILAVNAAQQSSKLARKGKFRDAQAYSINQKKYIKSNIKNLEDAEAYSGWKKQMNEFYNDVHEQNNMEEMEVEQKADIQSFGDDLNDHEEVAPKKKGFFSKLGDKMSKNIQKNRQFTSQNLKKK